VECRRAHTRQQAWQVVPQRHRPATLFELALEQGTVAIERLALPELRRPRFASDGRPSIFRQWLQRRRASIRKALELAARGAERRQRVEAHRDVIGEPAAKIGTKPSIAFEQRREGARAVTNA
jgi:hypothetical protein